MFCGALPDRYRMPAGKRGLGEPDSSHCRDKCANYDKDAQVGVSSGGEFGFSGGAPIRAISGSRPVVRAYASRVQSRYFPIITSRVLASLYRTNDFNLSGKVKPPGHRLLSPRRPSPYSSFSKPASVNSYFESISQAFRTDYVNHT